MRKKSIINCLEKLIDFFLNAIPRLSSKIESTNQSYESYFKDFTRTLSFNEQNQEDFETANRPLKLNNASASKKFLTMHSSL